MLECILKNDNIEAEEKSFVFFIKICHFFIKSKTILKSSNKNIEECVAPNEKVH